MFQSFQSFVADVVRKLSDAANNISYTLLGRSITLSARGMMCAGIYLVATGILGWLVHRYFYFSAMALAPNWNVNLAPQAGIYNSILTNYVIVVLSAVGGVAMVWVGGIWPALQKLFIALAEKCWPIAALAAWILLCLISVPISKCYLIAALILFIPQSIADNASTQQTLAPKALRAWLPAALGALLLGAFIIAGKAWYPVTLPNDYIELEDAANYPKASAGAQPLTASAKRNDILNCLAHQEQRAKEGSEESSDELWAQSKNILLKNMVKAIQSNDMKTITDAVSLKKIETALKEANLAASQNCALDIAPPELQKLKGTIERTGKWQSEAGRLLYHHSFVFVPALHVMTYGPLSPMAHLYGLGNSMFHAALLKLSSPTLTGYFSTYPIAQAAGILCIVLLVIYITRSFMAGLGAAALVLACLCSIGFEFILLPPGFSPMRYVGLAAQTASIVMLFRGTSFIRCLLFILSIVFSFIWNGEFAVIGLVGQLFALIAPSLQLGHIKRFALIALSLASAAACWIFNQSLAEGFLQGVGLGFFGMFPIPDWIETTILSIGVIAALAILLRLSSQFEGNERMARLCLLPIYALLVMKYLLYALAVHLLFVLVFVLPLALAHIRWNNNTAQSTSGNRLHILLASGLVLLAFGKSLAYSADAGAFRNGMILPYTLHQWDSLKESFATPIPQDPIASRVAAIKAEIKPDDTLLILSPFDHLLSFYVNPKHFCAHFEITVNPITYPMIHDIIDCARTTPNTLVVMDNANQTPCPDLSYADYVDAKSCALKSKLKQNSLAILKALGDSYTVVGTSGPLTFYRHK